MLTNSELAYFAGIIDGEGTIQIIRQSNKNRIGRPYFTTGFYLSNTNLALLRWVKLRFGGNKTKGRKGPGGKYYKSTNWKLCYRHQFYGDLAEKLVKAIRPYLVVKQKQADLYLAFRKRLKIYSHPLSKTENSIRENMYWKSRKLNARGTEPVKRKKF